MSTKLNAEELAAKRWPDWAIKKSRITSVDEAEIPKLKTYSIREGYAAAIREHSQPLADELEQVKAERDALVQLLRGCLLLMTTTSPAPKGTTQDEWGDIVPAIRAILAKYQKP